jgi:hypothetical protein
LSVDEAISLCEGGMDVSGFTDTGALNKLL